MRWFNDAKGYGFVGRDDRGPDIFAHVSSIQAEGHKPLNEGDAVTFDIVKSDEGPQADQVKVVKKVEGPSH